MTKGQETALREILLNYANDDSATVYDTTQAITAVLGCGDSPTLRDQFAMVAMISDSIQSAIVAAAYIGQGKVFNGEVPSQADEAKEYYKVADAMLEARKL